MMRLLSMAVPRKEVREKLQPPWARFFKVELESNDVLLRDAGGELNAVVGAGRHEPRLAGMG